MRKDIPGWPGYQVEENETVWSNNPRGSSEWKEIHGRTRGNCRVVALSRGKKKREFSVRQLVRWAFEGIPPMRFDPKEHEIEVNGDVAILRTFRLSGGLVEFLIDAADVPLLEAAGYAWHAVRVKRKDIYYAATDIKTEKGFRTLYLHRFLLGESPLVCDHINRNTRDNRRCNLRLVTYSGNAANRPPISTVRRGGVTFHKGRRKWQAQVSLKRKIHHAGSFATREEAEAALARKKQELGLS